MGLRKLFLAGLIMSIVFAGCNKDKNEDMFEELDVDNSEMESVAEDNESDAIFDEFYEESKPDQQEENPPPGRLQKTQVQSEPQFSPNGQYVVQVTCVQSKNYARKIAIKLEDKGYPVYIAEVEDPTPDLAGLYHRVRVGGFPTYRSARTFGEDYLVTDGYEYWVDNRSNDNIGFAGLGLGSRGTNKEYGVSGTSKQPYSNSEAAASVSRTETEQVEQKPPATPVSSAVPENSDVREQSSQIESPPEPKEMVSEQAPESTPVETPAEAVVQPTPAHNTTDEFPEPVESSEEEEDDWGELDEEWGSDTTDW